MDSGAAILSATQGISAFNSLLPPLHTVRRANFTVDAETVKDVRAGEFAAGAITISVGILIAALTRSAYPAIIALVISGLLIVVYESVLKSEGEN